MAKKTKQEEISEFMEGISITKDMSEAQAEKWYNKKLNENKKEARRLATAERKESQRKSVKTHKVYSPTPGRMYQFGYNAKTAKYLPYWDKYPLMICLGVSGKHILGINLHYIPPKQRAEFLDTIMRYSSTKNTSNSTYLKINYNKVKSLEWVPHMLKKYLFSHVVEVFQEISPKDWGKAIKLPTQDFTYKDTGKSVSATVAYNDRNKK